VLGVWIVDTTLQNIRYLATKYRSAHPHCSEIDIAGALLASRTKVSRLREYLNARYRKIEPMYPGNSDSSGVLLFAFPAGTDGAPCIGGFVVDMAEFVRTVINVRLEGAASSGILREGDATPVLRSDRASGAGLIGEKSLWLLPGHTIGVQLSGEPLEETIASRFAVNVALIVMLDVMLLAGAVVVYRNMRREMALAALKAGFVSNVSHELRTPLALIRMYAETLEMGRVTGEEKRLEYYATILRESERLSRLIAGILNFSRMETGRREYRFGPVDLNAAVGSVLATFDLELERKHCRPLLEREDHLPSIQADAEAVSEAIINLVENALKYSDKDPFLRIRTRSDLRNVFLEIEDHGIGIAPEHHKLIFEMFYRVDAVAVHSAKGTGIGLALVEHIMNAHGGTVTVGSRPGVGSTFVLTFPRQDSIPQQVS
jgi:two-component system phosphate regulon sensor histidine kinase PhoR